MINIYTQQLAIGVGEVGRGIGGCPPAPEAQLPKIVKLIPAHNPIMIYVIYYFSGNPL